MNYTEVIITIVQAVLVPLFLWGLTLLKQYVSSKVQATEIKSAIEITDKVIKAVVAKTSQTFVDELKSKNEFTAEAAKEAFNISINQSKDLLSAGTMELLQKVTGDANAYISARIEEAVREN